MKKKIFVLMLFIVMFLFCFKVNAVDIEDTNISGPLNPYAGGTGSYNNVNGIRVAIIDANENLVSGTKIVDIISTSDDKTNCRNKTFKVTSSHLTKPQYNKNSTTTFTFNKTVISANSTCNVSSINETNYKVISAASTGYDFKEYIYNLGIGSSTIKLKNYISNSDYAALKEYVRQTGYTCLDSSASEICKAVEQHYIIIEPLFSWKTNVGTGYELSRLYKYNSDMGRLWRSVAGNISLGKNYLNLISQKTQDNGKKSYQQMYEISNGVGIGIYKVSDFDLPEPTPSIPTTPSGSNSCTNDLTKLKESYNTCTNCRQCQDIAGLGAPASDVRACFASCEERCKSTYISGLFRLHDKYPEDTNLLNFSGASCGPANCGVPVASCFGGSFSIGATFDQNNLSCYTDKIDVSGNAAYCLTTFNFSNQILGWNTTPGKILFNTINGEVIKSTLTQKCYMYNSSPSYFSTGNYSDYIKNVTVVNNYDGIFLPLSEKKIDMTVDRKSTDGKFSYYFGSWTNIYKMNAIYADNGSGKLSSLSCPNCKFLGYGLVSELNQRGPSSLSFTFDFNTKYTKEKRINKYSATCPYTINSGLIGSKDEKDYMNLEFRIVNTNSDNLFLSKDGRGSREPGANWKGQEDILKNNNNSYNKDNSEPLYTITLTPSIMEDIKKYNKDNAYDDYNLECIKDGTVCISNYLTTLRSDYGLKINNSKKRACYEDNHC